MYLYACRGGVGRKGSVNLHVYTCTAKSNLKLKCLPAVIY